MKSAILQLYIVVIKSQPRVAYGTRAQATDYPSQVFLDHETAGFACGGSIISDQWVLTAAHCYRDDYKLIDIHMGLQRNDIEYQNNQVIRSVEEFIKHPDYDARIHSYDIALIKMNESIDFEKFTQLKPMCLDLCGLDMTNMECWFTGFGKNNNHYFNDDLQQLRMKLYDHEKCAEEFSRRGVERMTERQFCMVSYSKPLLSEHPSHGGGCSGDSGGPLQCYVGFLPRTWYQTGVAWATENCVNEATVFQNVTKYVDFIVQNSQYTLPDYCPPNPACGQN